MKSFASRPGTRHTPPRFELFKEFGHGRFWIARNSIQFFSLVFKGSRNEPSVDVSRLCETWANAHRDIELLNAMRPEDLSQHRELDGDVNESLESLTSRYDDLTGHFYAWERENASVAEKALTMEMGERLSSWEKLLTEAESSAHDLPQESHDPMESVDDYCGVRDDLEYLKNALFMLQHVKASDLLKWKRGEGPEPVRRFPRIDTKAFEAELEKLDVRFKKILHGRYASKAFWTDKTFWWNHPPRKEARRRA